MPSEFASLDTSFPNLEGKTTEQKLQSMTDYLYQLLEQLRYALHNISPENFNLTEVNGWAGETITEPLRVEIADAEAGLSTRIDVNAQGIQTEVTRATAAEGVLGSRITQTADAITSEVTRATAAEGTLGTRITQTADAVTAEASRATGAEAQLRLTAEGLATRVTNAEGDISTLEQTAAGLRTDVNSASGAASAAQQTANGIKAQVTDAQGNYTVLNLKSDGLHIGNASGTTKINGSNITTGTITANEISSSYVYAGNLSANQINTGTLSAVDIDGVKISGCEYYDEDEETMLDLMSFSGSNISALRLRNVPLDKTIFSVGDDVYNGQYVSTFVSMNGKRVLVNSEWARDDPDEVIAGSTDFGETTVKWRFPGRVAFDNKIVLKSGVNYGSTLPASGVTGEVFFKI